MRSGVAFAMPIFQKRERIYIIEDSLATAAVVHAGYRKQAAEALALGVSAFIWGNHATWSLAENTGSGTPVITISLPPRARKLLKSVDTASLIAPVCVFGRIAVKIEFAQIKVRHGGSHEILGSEPCAERYAA